MSDPGYGYDGDDNDGEAGSDYGSGGDSSDCGCD